MLKEDKSCVEANSTSRSKFEDRLPSTYSMKIQSLSQLNTLFPDDGYKSRSFSSGKYNWRLVIYPKDVEGNQFNALRPVWGFSQVVPLDTFNDPENGYVFDGDQCEFGVDVMVPHTNWEVVSFDQKPLYPKFSWTVNKFSKLKVNTYESKKFLMGGKNWVIMLYPKGKTNCKFLSLYLKADDKTIKEEVYAQVDMRIVDPFGCNHVTRTSKS
ncbi:unnamed protein product [Arabidopsis arenosa]|uniref:MATH domain-containing protein n=1 Tax=Arabidopsis arenosa TaxID=38785 RepID=A0A8S2A5M3_ARAAE|nr:unnamed protein product [Arabidopsis arenosa]